MEKTELRRINVKASKNYDVIIGENILNKLTSFIPVKSFKKAAIITDSNVLPLYENVVRNALVSDGKETCTFSFAAGEESKNMQTFSDILEFLANNKVTRSDIIVALGGGVVGDIAGFAAGVYLRGISFIQIPTTFLAAVDSSVGGKTAVDLANGKNLAGIFYQPSLVLCDTATFKTLSDVTFNDGLSETLKYGIICDEAFFKSLAGKTRKQIYSEIVPIVARCVEIKADIVAEDEFDTGTRQLLNFGHTAGHGIEKCSSYTISHGQAVAIGMAIMARAADKLGFSKEPITERILTALYAAGLPTRTDFNPVNIYEAALSDKKRNGNKINIVIPEKVGKCVLKEIGINELLDVIKAGLTYD